MGLLTVKCSHEFENGCIPTPDRAVLSTRAFDEKLELGKISSFILELELLKLIK